MTNNDGKNMEENIFQHYKNFLAETAKSLGMPVEELQSIQGFQSPEQVQAFIETLVQRYGVSQEKLQQGSLQFTDGRYLQTGESYNEWEL